MPLGFEFVALTVNGAAIPSVLTTNETRWLSTYPVDSNGTFSWEIGITNDTSLSPTVKTMFSNARNWFGLPFLSAEIGYAGPSSTTLYAGNSTTQDGFFYPEIAQPQFRLVDYEFWLAPRRHTPLPAGSDYPGMPALSLTHTNPLLITSVGNPAFQLACYAKLEVTNSYYSGVYGYLQQYFEHSLQISANGAVTTNTTGLLSPYGQFFGTEPGPVALVTLPDVDTGQRGTGVVNVIKLALDVNHDGTMDLSFAGPDNTSQGRPLVWWVNGDRDWATRTFSGSPAEPSRDISIYGGEISPNPDYRDTAIRSQRDLEDYSRLWICGMPSLPPSQGYQVTLSLANASTNTFAINLVNAVESDGGTGYLTDTNIAAAQVAYSDHTSPGYKFARLTTSQPYTFPDNYFTNSATKHFLFEGAGIGSGQLVLTISQATAQGTNVLAQTSMWLDLRDVKTMYEQVHISGVTNTVPPSGFLSSSFQQLNWVDASSDEDTNIIVFVHGWRMGIWDYENFSESMFKRLYWQGYRGRFISIRWDTLSKDDFKFASTLQSFTTYNSSEYRAWESAKGVSDYLTSLKQRFPNYNLNVCAHSMGNVVMAEALKLQLAAGQHNVNNYVLMQAAVPASCYDTSFTNYAPFLSAEQQRGPTPNTYRGYPGSIGNAVSGHLVDFYNTNDFALATGTWGGASVSWEANQITYKPDDGFGYTTDGTNCFVSPWNQTYRTVTESHEIMSFCARPRSKAVGAQPGVGGAIQGGSIDLRGNFGFNDKKEEHSAEFNWNIQRLNGFYHSLLTTLVPPE